MFSSDDRHSWLMKKGFKYVKLIDTAPPGHLFRFDQGELKQINLKNQGFLKCGFYCFNIFIFILFLFLFQNNKESNGQFHPQ